MKIGLILALLLFSCVMSALATVENQTVRLGDYVVSFDLGLPKDAYNVTALAPQQNKAPNGDIIQTAYAVLLQNKTDVSDGVMIVLSKSERELPQVPTASELGKVVFSKHPEGTSNFQNATRAVDGTEGAVESFDITNNGITKKAYQLAYLPKADERRLVLTAMSTIPSSYTIFDTFHVEKQK